MEDGALGPAAAAGVFQRPDTQLRPHVVVHVEALDAAVKAVQHRCQVEFPVLVRDFCGVREELFVWFLSRKFAVDEVFRLFRQPVGSGGFLGAAPALDSQVVLPADVVDAPVPAGVTPVEPEPGDDPPDAVVVAVFHILPQALVDLLQELTAPKPFSRSPEEPIVALLADAQHAAHGAGQRPMWARIKRYLWQGFTACGA